MARSSSQATGAAREPPFRQKDKRAMIRIIKHALDDLPYENLSELSHRVQDTSEEQAATPERAELMTDLTEGHDYASWDRVQLEVISQLGAFRFRQDLLRDSITAPEVASRLGTSRQTPHDRVAAGTLLAVKDRGKLRFPPWQFDPTGPDGVIAGLSDVLRALHVSPLAKISWLTRPNPYVEGLTPLKVLAEGHVDRIIELARSVEVT